MKREMFQLVINVTDSTSVHFDDLKRKELVYFRWHSRGRGVRCETITRMDDPHGCGKFAEAPGARRHADVEPTWMYSRRVSEKIPQSAPT